MQTVTAEMLGKISYQIWYVKIDIKMFAITKNIGIQTLEKNLFLPFCRYIKYLTAAKRHKHAAVYELSNAQNKVYQKTTTDKQWLLF